LNPRLQYWTSRGFAVLDVNYRGSTGYGRDYRRKLDGAWGIKDVDDCVYGARSLVADGKADPQRLFIMGGSAGGYTVLCALAFTDVFSGGISSYGIGDLAVLVNDTHKFEARYADRLVGPYDAALYRNRSPLFAAHDISAPVLFFQGTEDKVVPPNQTEDMVDALQSRGIPVAYVSMDGEGHGFRRSDSIERMLNSSLTFLCRLCGCVPADGAAELEIFNDEHLDSG
ncbi:MAG: S9 family peptidase, partial [Gammaproteobacteria bacterium]|nr:S9 family peptidase [Gammaproteobacteria bacterium]